MGETNELIFIRKRGLDELSDFEDELLRKLLYSNPVIEGSEGIDKSVKKLKQEREMNELAGLFSGMKLELNPESKIDTKKIPNKLAESTSWNDYKKEKNNQYALRQVSSTFMSQLRSQVIGKRVRGGEKKVIFLGENKQVSFDMINEKERNSGFLIVRRSLQTRDTH